MSWQVTITSDHVLIIVHKKTFIFYILLLQLKQVAHTTNMAPVETKPTAQEVITYGEPSSSPPDLRLIHYNDVYHLDSSSAEPVGGIARFITVCKEYQQGDRFQDQPECLTLFSGDAFNPSLESSITKGSHMVPILNEIKTDCAALGNHDLDFGVTQFRNLVGKCKFPWLVANILDPALGENVPIGNAKRTHIITASNGLKIGIIGLGEREWLETINSLPPDLIYKSASETAKELIPQLRADGADLIVALTHQREPNDNKLAEQVGDQIDLILGGHDHFYAHSYINGCHVLRSGTDFKQLSYIEARKSSEGNGKWEFVIYRRDIVSSIAEHKPTLQLAEKLTAKLKQSLEKPVGWTASPLDARFTTVRLKESNIGNFVCDIMQHHYGADCALMAAGTIRGDQIYQPGPIRVKDITDCFPFEDPIVVLKVTGKAIREALENGVSMYPALEGRFPQVASIKFTFDPKRPVGERVTEVDIAGDGYLPDKLYVLATRGYMGRGKGKFLYPSCFSLLKKRRADTLSHNRWLQIPPHRRRRRPSHRDRLGRKRHSNLHAFAAILHVPQSPRPVVQPGAPYEQALGQGRHQRIQIAPVPSAQGARVSHLESRRKDQVCFYYYTRRSWYEKGLGSFHTRQDAREEE